MHWKWRSPYYAMSKEDVRSRVLVFRLHAGSQPCSAGGTRSHHSRNGDLLISKSWRLTSGHHNSPQPARLLVVCASCDTHHSLAITTHCRSRFVLYILIQGRCLVVHTNPRRSFLDRLRASPSRNDGAFAPYEIPMLVSRSLLLGRRGCKGSRFHRG